MQTQAGPVPARAGLQPQFWKLWQKGVRHTLVLLLATPHGLQDLRLPNPGHSKWEELESHHKANRELVPCSLFLLLLKNIVTTVE